jgi:hypothetical protein
MRGKPSRTKDRELRERSRAQGLRPIEIWGSAAFRAEAQRQSAAVAMSSYEREDQAFIDAITDWS